MEASRRRPQKRTGSAGPLGRPHQAPTRVAVSQSMPNLHHGTDAGADGRHQHVERLTPHADETQHSSVASLTSALHALDAADRQGLTHGARSRVSQRLACLYSRGRLLHAAGSYAEAVQDFGRCLAVEPLEARAYELRALSRRKLLDFGGACDDYRCAAAIRSGQLEGYMKAHGLQASGPKRVLKMVSQARYAPPSSGSSPAAPPARRPARRCPPTRSTSPLTAARRTATRAARSACE